MLQPLQQLIPLLLFAVSLYLQGFAEKLFKRLSGSHERFETRIAILNVVSRCVGVHKLLILNFYPFLQVGAWVGGCQHALAAAWAGWLACQAFAPAACCSSAADLDHLLLPLYCLAAEVHCAPPARRHRHPGGTGAGGWGVAAAAAAAAAVAVATAAAVVESFSALLAPRIDAPDRPRAASLHCSAQLFPS